MQKLFQLLVLSQCSISLQFRGPARLLGAVVVPLVRPRVFFRVTHLHKILLSPACLTASVSSDFRESGFPFLVPVKGWKGGRTMLLHPRSSNKDTEGQIEWLSSWSRLGVPRGALQEAARFKS